MSFLTPSSAINAFQAQNHARKASKATAPTAAIEEHDLAAGQFACAAEGTQNSEVKLTP